MFKAACPSARDGPGCSRSGIRFSGSARTKVIMMHVHGKMRPSLRLFERQTPPRCRPRWLAWGPASPLTWPFSPVVGDVDTSPRRAAVMSSVCLRGEAAWGAAGPSQWVF